MASRELGSTRNDYPGKSDQEIAEVLATQYGYIAVVRYKNSADRPDFTNLGVCNTEAEIRGYVTSPYCHNVEVIYDRRSAVFPLNAAHVLNGHCENCGKHATRGSLQIGAGNDFYFCPKCGLLFCDNCYPRLPLTASPGYGTCTKCRVQVKRTLPSCFVNQPLIADHAKTVPGPKQPARSREARAALGSGTSAARPGFWSRLFSRLFP